VGIYSLEMSKDQLVQRLICSHAGIDSHRLRTGFIEEAEWAKIAQAIGELSECPIYIDDTPGISIMELRTKARRLQAEHDLGFIVVDYLQLMQGRRDRFTDNRVQEVSEISQGLKALARELNVPVLACSQLSRAVEQRPKNRPQLSDLRESGCLAGEAEVYLPDEGVYRRIDQLVGRSGFNVLALDTTTWKLESRPVLRAFATGRKPVYRLTTRLGRSIRATANHRFLTIDGWRRLDELAPGARLAIPRSLPSPTHPTPPIMSNAELALLGHLIGDGCTLPRHIVQYTTNDIDLATTVARLAQAVRSVPLARLAASDVYWDDIVSIDPDGDAEVYDLTVDGLHNFVANNTVTHNSIEQDADIVMFIYREELYDRETPRRNVADIIVAKHRNGPLADIELRFDAQMTRFADLETRYSRPG
jgi:replicative DNA helicase